MLVGMGARGQAIEVDSLCFLAALFRDLLKDNNKMKVEYNDAYEQLALQDNAV